VNYRAVALKQMMSPKLGFYKDPLKRHFWIKKAHNVSKIPRSPPPPQTKTYLVEHQYSCCSRICVDSTSRYLHPKTPKPTSRYVKYATNAKSSCSSSSCAHQRDLLCLLLLSLPRSTRFHVLSCGAVQGAGLNLGNELILCEQFLLP